MDQRRKPLHGVAAEFTSAASLEEAVRQTLQAGYTRVEAYTPFAIESVTESLHGKDRRIAFCTLVAAMMGALSGFGMCWYAFVVFFPLNIGGRPNNSWPAWIPITFEMTVLFGAIAAVVSMLLSNRLPRLHHPMFDVPGFDRASRDRFFLCIGASDPRFNVSEIRALFAASDALRISEVPA